MTLRATGAVLLLLVSVSASASQAEPDDQAGILCARSEMALRQPDAAENIEFDATGSRVGRPVVGYWYADSMFQCSRVVSDDTKITFEGKRIILEFVPGPNYFKRSPSKRDVRVSIARGEKTSDAREFKIVLSKVFVMPNENPVDLAPEYWGEPYLHRTKRDVGVVENADHADQESLENVAKVADGITPPQVVFDPEPHYPELAERTGLEAMSVLWVIIETDGTVKHVRIQRAAGHGFDDAGAEIVKTWRFIPAKKGRVPVRVQANIEVNFQCCR